MKQLLSDTSNNCIFGEVSCRNSEMGCSFVKMLNFVLLASLVTGESSWACWNESLALLKQVYISLLCPCCKFHFCIWVTAPGPPLDAWGVSCTHCSLLKALWSWVSRNHSWYLCFRLNPSSFYRASMESEESFSVPWLFCYPQMQASVSPSEETSLCFSTSVYLKENFSKSNWHYDDYSSSLLSKVLYI